jgi:hypothetical protein
MILFVHCQDCGTKLKARAHKLAGRCIPCREHAAKEVRKGWCVLTPHKQGAMFFTAAYAREAAIGINNKGGLIK